jgi:tRNA pseudouridine55 synthase
MNCCRSLNKACRRIDRGIGMSLQVMMTFATNNKQDSLQAERRCSLSGKTTPSATAGIFPVDKPEGVSSFRMVQLVRRILGIKKVGHTGTLDPFASGVLIVCAGRPATRLIPRLMEGDKEYEATLHLGVTTDTGDPEGRVVERRQLPDLAASDIAECLAQFTGEQMQTPPAYSALKHKGKPLYYYARRGIEVVKEPRCINIKQLQCLDLARETITLKVVCSRGTYIRTLAADIGEFLGCGAHLCCLKRTRNGFFSLDEALPGEKLFIEETGRSLLESHRISVDMMQELLADSE